MSVRIIVDSACDMASADHPALTVLPLSVAFGTDMYLDGVDLTHERFYELLISGDVMPSTGQITPYAYAEAFAEAAAAGDDVVVLTLSAKLSGTHQSAATAAAEAPGTVYVVDTQNVTLGMRVLVEYALALVDQGKSAQEIASAVERERGRVRLFGLLDTLEYLKRGGRIPSAVGAIGEMLAIKPVVAIEDGEVKVLGKARGIKKGRSLMTKFAERAGGIDFHMPIAVGYAGLTDAPAREYLADDPSVFEGHASELPFRSVGVTIGTHVGPGAVAYAFFCRE